MTTDTHRDDLPADQRLRITEIFCSIQGEAQHSGWPTVFVRLTGCPLRCQYCDTAYAFHGGQWIDFDDIMEKVDEFGVAHVCITGGEPLAQKNAFPLIALLCDRGKTVSVETSGAMDVSGVDPRCVKVLDIKTPGSREEGRNRLENLALLGPNDQIKFVICDRDDYEWAREFTHRHGLDSKCTVWFSASHAQLPHRQLADWILDDRLPVRFQMQLHKLLWDDKPGH
ncbi:MAG: 7-carboxy-7-deazaguanine synthase QueE [Gammaproteobacteria bacterium]|nr:7-carboxy-7-deazaguanine synthase QueE [Gammaproteobacteria bacterium]